MVEGLSGDVLSGPLWEEVTLGLGWGDYRSLVGKLEVLRSRLESGATLVLGFDMLTNVRIEDKRSCTTLSYYPMSLWKSHWMVEERKNEEK